MLIARELEDGTLVPVFERPQAEAPERCCLITTAAAPAAAVERERTRQVAGAGLGQVPERDIPLDAHVGERPL